MSKTRSLAELMGQWTAGTGRHLDLECTGRAHAVALMEEGV